MASFHTQYRPITFAEVIGQNHVVASLKQAAKTARAHSYIFTGPSGTGKTTLARILGNEFAQHNATVANIKEIDAATSSGADDMRAVVAGAYSKAIGKSPIKTIIVDEAHRLSAAAWTILLKPIEEPPKHVYWAFCTTEAGKIPKTIQTRCLRYDLKPVNELLIFELLDKVVQAEQIKINDEVLEAIAEGAGGSPRQALVSLEACLHCETAAEARIVMRSAGQSKETIDLCRFLLQASGRSWDEAMKIVKALEGFDAEGVRIAIVNYLSAALMNAKGENKAKHILSIMEPFLTPYNASDRMAPLLHSLGLALDLDK